MKELFKIITGKKQDSSAKISGYKKKTMEDQVEAKGKLEQALEAVAQANVEVLCGERDKAEVEPLAAAVRDLEDQAETLDLVISKLDEKYQEALARERQAQIDEINKKIDGLKKWAAEIRPEYIKAKVICEAYEKIMIPPSFLGDRPASREHLLLTQKERETYKSEVDQMFKGHGGGSVMAEIKELQRQRDELKKG